MRLGRAPLWAATVLGVGWRAAHTAVGFARSRGRSAGSRRKVDPIDERATRRDIGQPADERTIRRDAETELGGASSEQSRMAFETGVNPGGTHAEPSEARTAPAGEPAGEISTEDEQLSPEEAAIDDEEHGLAHERRHRRGMAETRRGA